MEPPFGITEAELLPIADNFKTLGDLHRAHEAEQKAKQPPEAAPKDEPPVAEIKPNVSIPPKEAPNAPKGNPQEGARGSSSSSFHYWWVGLGIFLVFASSFIWRRSR